MSKIITTEEFKEKARKIHGDKYDYSTVIYKSSIEPVFIKCKEHGIFKQSPSNHLAGKGCRKCSKIPSKSKLDEYLSKFILKSNIKHENKYSYIHVKKYKDAKTKVPIECKKHGIFLQSPDNHMRGRGCPKCKFENTGNIRKLSKDSLILKFCPWADFFY